MDLLLENKEPLVFVRNAGDRKTASVKDKLDSLRQTWLQSGLNYDTTSLVLRGEWIFRLILLSRNEEKEMDDFGLFQTLRHV